MLEINNIDKKSDNMLLTELITYNIKKIINNDELNTRFINILTKLQTNMDLPINTQAPDLHIIKLESEGWDSDVVDKSGGSIYGYYLYDKNYIDNNHDHIYTLYFAPDKYPTSKRQLNTLMNDLNIEVEINPYEHYNEYVQQELLLGEYKIQDEIKPYMYLSVDEYKKMIDSLIKKYQAMDKHFYKKII